MIKGRLTLMFHIISAETITCHNRIICHNTLRIAEMSPFRMWPLFISESYKRNKQQNQRVVEKSMRQQQHTIEISFLCIIRSTKLDTRVSFSCHDCLWITKTNKFSLFCVKTIFCYLCVAFGVHWTDIVRKSVIMPSLYIRQMSSPF